MTIIKINNKKRFMYPKSKFVKDIYFECKYDTRYSLEYLEIFYRDKDQIKVLKGLDILDIRSLFIYTSLAQIPLHRVVLVKYSGHVCYKKYNYNGELEMDYTPLTKKDAAEYLNCDKSEVSKFEFKTPKGQLISGFISRSRDISLGSMIIEYVNKEPSLQYVQGMPKLHYPTPNDLKTIKNKQLDLPVKEDGTNIVFYKVKDEILTKTRLRPFISDTYRGLLNTLSTGASDYEIDNYKQLVNDTGYSLSCELYGSKNQHLIRYDKLAIDLRLDAICILDKGRAIPKSEFIKLCKEYNISYLDSCFYVNSDKVTPKEWFCKRYKVKDESIEYSDLNDLYLKLEKYFQSIDDQFGVEVIEGACFHVSDSTRMVMYKCKAEKIRDLHRFLFSTIDN